MWKPNDGNDGWFPLAALQNFKGEERLIVGSVLNQVRKMHLKNCLHQKKEEKETLIFLHEKEAR